MGQYDAKLHGFNHYISTKRHPRAAPFGAGLGLLYGSIGRNAVAKNLVVT